MESEDVLLRRERDWPTVGGVGFIGRRSRCPWVGSSFHQEGRTSRRCSLQGPIWQRTFCRDWQGGPLLTLVTFLLNLGDLNRYQKIKLWWDDGQHSTLYQMLCTNTPLLSCTVQRL
jgi:hypothetical protein